MSTRRKQPQRLPELSARERILDAALGVLGERGYDGLSLRQLAHAVDLHNSTLFHHFRDKADLARAVVDAVAERQLEIVAPLRADSPPSLEAFLDVLAAWATHLQGAPREARLLLRAMADTGDSTPWTRSEGGGPLDSLSTALHDWLARARSAAVVGDIEIDEFERAIWGVLLFSRGGAEPRDAKARDTSARIVRALFGRALKPDGD